jgi:Na+/melibiose symporter-like transporter
MINKEISKFSFKDSFVYGSPAIGAGYMYLLMAIYVMKFATDILLIAPAIVGLIFSISRVWDAINDPLVGYLSDKTKWALGRRRSWLLISIVPISIFYLMVFFPPQYEDEKILTFWFAIGILGFYTSMTIFVVPHLSLGAELSDRKSVV